MRIRKFRRIIRNRNDFIHILHDRRKIQQAFFMYIMNAFMRKSTEKERENAEKFY